MRSKRNVLTAGFVLRLLEPIVALVDVVRRLRRFSLCTVAVLCRPQEPEGLNDHLGHIALLPLTILVTPQLEPSFNVKKFPLGNVFASDLCPSPPCDTRDPEDVGLLVSLTVLEGFVDGQRERGHGRTARGDLHLTVGPNVSY